MSVYHYEFITLSTNRTFTMLRLILTVGALCGLLTASSASQLLRCSYSGSYPHMRGVSSFSLVTIYPTCPQSGLGPVNESIEPRGSARRYRISPTQKVNTNRSG